MKKAWRGSHLSRGVAPHQPSVASDQDARFGRAYTRNESIGQLRTGPAGPADLEILKYGL